MCLGTFGAIMTFSLEMVQSALDAYTTAVQRAKDPVVKETLETLLEEAKKNLVLMERVRRENITEMILEPIAGMDRTGYESDKQLPDQAQDIDLVKTALITEKQKRKFFHEASTRVPIPEVERIFRNIIKKKETNLVRLEGLQ